MIKLKKEDIEKGLKLFTETLKDTKLKKDFTEDVSYLRKLDGKFLDSSNQECFILGSVLIAEDLEKVALLERVTRKIIEKQNVKFEDLGEVELE